MSTVDTVQHGTVVILHLKIKNNFKKEVITEILKPVEATGYTSHEDTRTPY